MEIILGIVGCYSVLHLAAYRLGGPIEKGDDHGYRPDLARVSRIVYAQSKTAPAVNQAIARPTTSGAST